MTWDRDRPRVTLSDFFIRDCYGDWSSRRSGSYGYAFSTNRKLWAVVLLREPRVVRVFALPAPRKLAGCLPSRRPVWRQSSVFSFAIICLWWQSVIFENAIRKSFHKSNTNDKTWWQLSFSAYAITCLWRQFYYFPVAITNAEQAFFWIIHLVNIVSGSIKCIPLLSKLDFGKCVHLLSKLYLRIRICIRNSQY